MRLTSMPLHMRRLLLGTTALTGFVALASAAHAGQPGLPAGGVVTSGTAKIGPVTGNQLSVTTGGPRTVIDWQSFSIAAGNKVTIEQPGTNSVTVNEVVGATPSQIFGELSSNGRVVLANPNGIWFGADSHVDVAGLVASTATLSQSAVKNFAAGGRLSLDTAGKATASIVNDGRITIANQGLAAFVAPGVRNSGIIQATLGTVQLASGATSTLDFYGDGLVSLAVTAPVTALAVGPDGKTFKTTVENTGTLSAAGGHVLVTADVVKGVVDNVINMSGVAEAKGVTVSGGDIVLDGGDGGVTVAGTVDVSGAKPGQTGGTVQVTGGTVTLASTAKVDASGAKGGGTVQIGGGPHGGGTLHHAAATTVQAGASITANATRDGSGGTVSVWSDGQTTFDGSISARGAGTGAGGWVETSGHYLSIATGHVDTGAPGGPAGTWLLDPYNLTVIASGPATETLTTGGGTSSASSVAGDSTVLASDVDAALANNNVILQTGGSGGSITVNTGLTWSSGHNLRLDTSASAPGNINIDGAITATNNGSLTLVSSGTVLQNQPIQVPQLELLGTGGTFILTNTSNNIAILSGNTGALVLDNGGHALTIGAAGGTTGLALTNTFAISDLSGVLTLDGNISASSVDFTPSTTGATGVSLATSVTIDTSAANGTIQLGPVDGPDSLTLTSGTGGISLTGSIGANTPLGSLSVTGGTITLPSSVTTSGEQTYQGAVTVTGATTLAVEGEAGVSISGSLDGSGNSESVTLSGGGTISLIGAIGATHPLGALTVESGAITLNGTITTSGTSGQFYSGAITLSGDTTLTDNATGPISVASTIDGSQALTINTGGLVHLVGAIGSNTQLGSLTVTGSAIVLGDSSSFSNSVTTSNDQTYTGPLTIDTTTTLTSNGGNLNFHGPIGGFTNGGQSLTLVAAGAVEFDDDVGTANLQLNQFSLTAASVSPNPPTVFSEGSPSITLTGNGGPTTVDLQGNVTYTTGLANDTIILTADTTITASSGNLILNGTIDGGSNLSLIDTVGNISLTGAVGSTTPLTSLTLQSGGLVTISNAVTTTGAFLSHSQGGNLANGFTLASTGSITSQTGNVTIYTDANSDTTVGTTITIGGAITANGIYLKAADQAFNDPGVVTLQGTAVLNNTETNVAANPAQADVVLYAGTGGTINLQSGMTIQASSGNIALIADALNIDDSPANISTPGSVIIAPASTTGLLSGGSNYTDVSQGENGTSAILTGSLPSGVNESTISVGVGDVTFLVQQALINAVSGSTGTVGQLQIGLPNMGAGTSVEPPNGETINFPITTTIYGGTIATSGAITGTTINLIAGGTIDLSSPITVANSFTATTSGPITLESVGSINFGSVGGDTATLISNGGGDVTVNGAIASTAAGTTIALSASDGAIVTAVGGSLQTPGAVTLAADGITLNGNVAANTIQAQSTGSITINGQLLNTQDTGSISLVSTNEGGQVTSAAAADIEASGLTITGPGGIQLNGTTSATTASLASSSGTIDLEGAFSAGTASIIAGGGPITIAGTLNIGGGGLQAQFSNSFSLTGSITDSGSVVISPNQGSNPSIDIAGTITAQGIDISALGTSPSTAGHITLESTAVLHNTEANASNSASSADLVLYTGPGSAGIITFNQGATVEADSGNIAFITDHFNLAGSGTSTIATPGTVIYTPATTTGAFTGPSTNFDFELNNFGVNLDIGTSATVVPQALVNLLSNVGGVGTVGTLQIGLPGTANTTSISSTVTFPLNTVVYGANIILNGDDLNGSPLVTAEGALSLVANGGVSATSSVLSAAGVLDVTFKNENAFTLDSGSSISSAAGVIIHAQSTGGEIDIDGHISAPEILLLASDHQNGVGGTITLESLAVLTNTLTSGINNAADHADTVLYAGPGGTITLEGGSGSGATINGGDANIALIADTINVNVNGDTPLIAISTSGRLIVSPGSTDGQLFTSLAVPDPYTTGSNVDTANYPFTLLGLIVPGGGSVNSVSIAGTGSDNVDLSQNLINNLSIVDGNGVGNNGNGIGTLQIGLRGNSARMDIDAVNLPVSTVFYSGTIDVHGDATVSTSATQTLGSQTLTPSLSFFSTEQLDTIVSGLTFEAGSGVNIAGAIFLGSDCAVGQCSFSNAPISSFAGTISGSQIRYSSAADADHGIQGDQVSFAATSVMTASGTLGSPDGTGIVIQTGRGGSLSIAGGAQFTTGVGVLELDTDTLLVPGAPVISTSGLLLGSGTTGNTALDAFGDTEAAPTIALGGGYVSAADLGRLTAAISAATPLTIGDASFTPVNITTTGTITLPQTNVTLDANSLGGTGTIAANNVSLTSTGDMEVDSSLALTGTLDIQLRSGSGQPQSFTQGIGSTLSAAGGVLLDYSTPPDPTIGIHGTISGPEIYLLAADNSEETGSIELFGTSRLINTHTTATSIDTSANTAYTILYTGSGGTITIDDGATLNGGLANLALVSDHLVVAPSATTLVSTAGRVIVTPTATDAFLVGGNAFNLPEATEGGNFLFRSGSSTPVNTAINTDAGDYQLSGAALAVLGGRNNSVGLLQIGLGGNTGEVAFAGSTTLSGQTVIYGSALTVETGAALTVVATAHTSFGGTSTPAGLTFEMDRTSTSNASSISTGAGSVISAPGAISIEESCVPSQACGSAPTASFGGSITTGTTFAYDGTVDQVALLQGATISSTATSNLVGSLSFTAGSLVLDGTLQTAGGAIVISAPVTIDSGKTATITTAGTGGEVLFGSTINGPGSLVVSAPTSSVTEDGVVGSATPLNSLSITATSITLSDETLTVGNQAYVGAVRLADGTSVSSTAGSVRFGGTIDSLDSAVPLTITAPQNVELDGALGGSTELSSLTVIGGQILLGNAVTTSGSQTYQGPVVLLGNVSLGSTDASVIFSSTVNGTTAGEQALTVSAPNTVTLGGAVGGTTPLASLTISGGEVQLDGNVTTTGAQSYTGPVFVLADSTVTSTAGAIDFNNTIDGATSGGQSLVISSAQAVTLSGVIGGETALDNFTLTAPSVSGNLPSITVTGTQTINVASAAFGGTYSFDSFIDNGAFILSGDTVITATAGDIDITGQISGTHALTLNDSVGIVSVTGSVDPNAILTSLTITASHGIVLGGAISTSGGQSYTGPTTLGDGTYVAGTTFNVSGAATLSGAPTITANGIAFSSTLDGAANLTLAAGSGGISVSGSTGGQTALASLILAGDGGSIASFGNIATNQFVDTRASGTVAIAGNLVTPSYVANAQNSVVINIEGSFGPTSGPLSLAGELNLGNALDLGGQAITLAGATVLDTSSGNHLLALGTVNGAFGLTLNAGSGGISTGVVGGQTALASLTATGGTVTMAGAATTGAQTYSGTLDLGGTYAASGFTANGATQLINATTVTVGAGDINFGTIDGGFSLGLNAGSGTVSTGTVGGQSPLISVGIDAGSITLGSVTTTGTQTYSGSLDLGGAYSALAFTAGGATHLSGVTTVTTGPGDISFGAIDGAFALALNADGGTVTTGPIGGQTALASLTETGGAITASGATTTGAQTYAGPLDLGGTYAASGFTADGTTKLTSATTVTAGAGGITFGTVDGAFSLGLNAGSGTVSTGLVGGQTALASLTETGATITASGATTTGAQIYSGALDLGGAYAASGFAASGATQLTGATTVSASGGGISFGTIDGAFDLGLNAGTGAVSTGLVGSQTALASLTVSGSTITASGATTTGAQSYSGALDLGGAYAASDFTANGPTQLTGATTVSAGGGGISFGAVDGAFDLGLNGGTGSVSTGTIGGQTALASLTVSGGTITVADVATTGAQSYSGTLNLGGTYNAGSFAANGATQLTGATAVTAGAGGISFGPVDGAFDLALAASDAPVSLGTVGGQTALASLTVTGSTIVLGSATTTGVQTYSGALDLGGAYAASGFAASGATQLTGATTVSAGGGGISFGTIDGAFDLGLNAGTGAVSTGLIGSQTALASLTVNGSTITASGATTTGAQSYSGALDLGGAYAASDFTANGPTQLIGATTVSAGGGGISFGAVDGAFDLGLNGGTGSVSTGTIGGQTALASLTVSGGTITVADVATTGAQSYSGTLNLGGTYNAGSFAANGATQLTGATAVTAGAGGISFGPVDGAFDLALAASDASVSLGTVGGQTALASLTVTGSTIVLGSATTTGTQTYSGSLDLGGAYAASGFAASGATQLTGATTVSASGGGISFGTIDGAFDLGLNAGAGAVTTGLVGSQTALASLTVSGSTITASGATTTGAQSYSGALDLGGAYAASDFTANGPTQLTGAVTVSANNGGISFGTGDGPTHFTDAVVVTAGGGSISFGAVDGAFDLALNAGSGPVSTGTIGGQTALASLTVTGGTITVADVTTTGAQSYSGRLNLGGTYSAGSFAANGATQLTGATAVTAGAGGISFGPVDGAFDLALAASDAPVSLGTVGGQTALASLTVTGSTIVLGSATTTGTQTYSGSLDLGGAYAASGFAASGATQLTGATTVSAGGGISFGTIDGAFDLGLNAVTGAVSTGVVGSQTALASLTVSGSTITASGATTTGAQSYSGALDLGGAYAASDFTANGPTQLIGAATVSAGGGGISFGAVDGAFDLGLNGGTGSVSTGTIGGQAALASLTVSGGTITVADVTTTGAQSYSGTLNLGGTYNAGSFAANGATELTAATTVAAGGGISFGTIDGASALALDAATITAGTIGGQTALSSLTLGSSGGAVSFTGDVATNQFIDTRNSGTLSVAGNLLTSSYVANLQDSVLISLGGSLGLPTGGPLSIAGQLNFANAVDLGVQTLTLVGATVLDTSANGSALTLGTVDGGFDLSLNAGSGAVSAGVVGSQARLASLTIQGGTIALGSVTTTGAQNYFGALDLGGAYVASSFLVAGPTRLALDTAVTTSGGNIVFGSVDGNAVLALDAGTGSVITGAMGGQTPLESLAVRAGTISVGSVATLGAQTYDGALALGGTYTASDFTAAGPTQLTGTTAVTTDQAGIVLGTVDGAFGLTLDAGTGTVATGAIGAKIALSNLTLAGINDAVTIAGDVVTNQLVDTRTVGSLAISGNLVTGSYAAVPGSDVAIDVTGGLGPVTGALAIAGTLNFQNAVDLGSHALTLSGTTVIDTSGGNALTLGAVDGAFGLTLNAGSGVLTVGRIGAQTALASLTLSGNGSVITLGGINGGAANATGAPTSFGVTTGQLIDQRSSGSLAILGGLNTSGFTEAASNSVLVTVDGALGTGALALAGQFNLVNALTIGSRAVTLTGATVLDTSANNGALTLGSVDGNFGLTLNAGTAAVALQGAAGANAALANLTVNAGSISLGSVSTAGAQVYNGTTSFNGTYRGSSFTTNGADLLSGNTGVLATGGNIVIGGTLNGADALVLTDANGLVTFGGPVGGQVALTSLTVTANGIVVGSVTTTGAQSYAGPMSFSGNFTANGFTTSGPLVMIGDTTVNGGTGDINFDGSIAGQHTLSLLSSDANVFFNGTAGAPTSRLSLLSIAGANNVTIGVDPATGSTYSLWVVDFSGNIKGAFNFGDHSLESDDVVTIQASSVDGRVISTSATISAGNVSGIIQGDTVSVTATGAINEQISAGDATVSGASFSGSVSGTRSVTLTSGVVSDASITSAGLAKITASQSISADISGGSVEVDAKTADVSGTITAVGGGAINVTANNLTSTITNPGNATTVGGAINVTANNVDSTISDKGGPITINANNVGGRISDAGGPITITANNVDSTISDQGGPITINAHDVSGNISDTGGPIVINGNQIFATVSNTNGPITINGNDVGGKVFDQNGLITINGNNITSTISDQGGQIVLNGPNVNPTIVEPGLALIINGNPVDPASFENAAEAAAAGITQAVLGVTQQLASIGDDAANGPQGAGDDDSSQGDSSDDGSSGDGDKKKKKDKAKDGDATYDFANQYIDKLISGKGPKAP